MNTLSSRSVKLGDKLYLAKVELPEQSSSDGKQGISGTTNHVFCCDISGSMYCSLPKMREQLKNRIHEIVMPMDTVTIIVFSGKDECTTLKELVQISDTKALMEMNKAIDRFMVPQGMTCFLDPVVYTDQLVAKSSSPFNWIFLSDGGNNDCPWTSVVSALEKVAPKLNSATIIEYGYHADTAKLTEMTEILGGTKIMAEDFDSYVPVIEGAFGAKAEGRKTIDVSSVKPSMRYTQFMYMHHNMVYIVVANGQTSIEVPESVNEIYYLASKSVGEKTEATPEALYAMAYAYAMYMRYEVVEKILYAIGDKKFIDMYNVAYGKQKLFEFQNEVLKAAFDENYRGEIDPSFKPNNNRYSLVDLFEDLRADENEVFVASPYFVYNRIGAKSVNKVVLTDAQKGKLNAAKTQKDVNKVMTELQENGVKMEMVNRGYPITNFVWNEERANLSAQFMIDVVLTLPKNNYGIDTVDSFVFRNYTIIKDGILNVAELPVKLTDATLATLNKKCHDIISTNEDGIIMLDLTKLPLVNKNQTQKVKMHEMTEKLLHLTSLKFKLKYLGYLKKKLQLSDDAAAPRFYKGGDPEVIKWLAGLGITSKGYQPKTELDKSGDSYLALAFKTDFKSFSSIPKVEDIESKLNSGKKLTPSEKFLRDIMLSIDATYLDGVKGLKYNKAVRSAFTQFSEEKARLQQEVGAIKFGMILSRKWFSDCSDMSVDTDAIQNAFGDEMTIQYRFTETKQNL